LSKFFQCVIDELDRNRHKQRTENRAKNPVKGKEKPRNISLSHPSLATYHKLQETLKEAGIFKGFIIFPVLRINTGFVIAPNLIKQNPTATKRATGSKIEVVA
jgi:hypothetical protein